MSATIGNPDAFATELGIKDKYSFCAVPNQWPAHTRPVFDLGAPKMGHKSTPTDYEKQAEVIAHAIQQCPPDWKGVIHVTRKTEAALLAKRLSRYSGLSNRLWTPDTTDGTNIQMEEWKKVKKKNEKTGMIAITWTWAEGVDLREERICIVAKTQFPTLGDDYEVARRNYNGKTYLWRTAVALEQSLGRTRRGEPEDYDNGSGHEQLVAIADGNWRRVKSYLSNDLMDSIQDWK